MTWVNENLAMVLGVLLAISEGLALIPYFQSNSIFQAILNGLKALVGSKPPEIK